MTGTTNLVEIVTDALNYDLGTRAAEHFSELDHLSYLADLPSLPCCAGDDPTTIEVWAAGISRIVETGQLPEPS